MPGSIAVWLDELMIDPTLSDGTGRTGCETDPVISRDGADARLLSLAPKPQPVRLRQVRKTNGKAERRIGTRTQNKDGQTMPPETTGKS